MLAGCFAVNVQVIAAAKSEFGNTSTKRFLVFSAAMRQEMSWSGPPLAQFVGYFTLT
jgi:hypothetical protein